MFRKRIAVDLGTANTLIHVPGQGVVLNTPSMVAIDSESHRILAVGADAKTFLGKTPQGIDVVRPLKDGVIADFDMAGELLRQLLRQSIGVSNLSKPDVLVCVPLNISNVERRAVIEAAQAAGAHTVYLIAEPMAGAVGANLAVLEPEGHMVVDIGGGTTDIAVISVGALSGARCLRLAGDTFTRVIQECVREKFSLIIGENMAERAKIAVGALTPGDTPLSATVSGKDLHTGAPNTVQLTDADLRPALLDTAQPIVDAVLEVLERTPPELGGDLLTHGMLLTGGGSLLRGMDTLLSNAAHIPAVLDDEPLTTVLRGAAVVLEHLDRYSDLLLQE